MKSEAGGRLIEELMRFKPDGLTANGWAVSAGVSRTIWADLRRHGNPSRRTLERLLAAVGSSLAEFEALRVGEAPPPGPIGNALADRGLGWRGAALASIPVLATSVTGEWGERGSQIDVHSIDRAKVEGQADRPTALAGDRDAYAVTVAGQSMWPRFRAGRRLLVSPAVAVEVGAEDVCGRAAEKRLGGPRRPLEEHVPARHRGDEQQLDGCSLADHDLPDLFLGPLPQGGQTLVLQRDSHVVALLGSLEFPSDDTRLVGASPEGPICALVTICHKLSSARRLCSTGTYGGDQVSTWSILRSSSEPRSPVGLVKQPAQTQVRRTISHSPPSQH